jgi:hypothetical protein
MCRPSPYCKGSTHIGHVLSAEPAQLAELASWPATWHGCVLCAISLAACCLGRCKAAPALIDYCQAAMAYEQIECSETVIR